jgi:hypothetical protein
MHEVPVIEGFEGNYRYADALADSFGLVYESELPLIHAEWDR